MARTQSQTPEQTKAVAGKGRMTSLIATNVSGSTKYLFAYDNANAASGTILFGPIPVPADGMVMLEDNALDSDDDVDFTNGIFIASSSTSWPFTASGTNDFMFNLTTKARR